MEARVAAKYLQCTGQHDTQSDPAQDNNAEAEKTDKEVIKKKFKRLKYILFWGFKILNILTFSYISILINKTLKSLFGDS